MPSRDTANDREYPNKITLGLSDEGWDVLTDLVAYFKKRRNRKSTNGGVVDSLLIIAKKDGSSMNDRIEMLLPIRSTRSLKRASTGQGDVDKTRREAAASDAAQKRRKRH